MLMIKKRKIIWLSTSASTNFLCSRFKWDARTKMKGASTGTRVLDWPLCTWIKYHINEMKYLFMKTFMHLFSSGISKLLSKFERFFTEKKTLFRSIYHLKNHINKTDLWVRYDKDYFLHNYNKKHDTKSFLSFECL